MNQGRYAPPRTVKAWDNASTGVAGKSASLDTIGAQVVTAFGTTSGASTLTVEVSQDGSTWYSTADTVAANGNFRLTFTTAAQFVRLSSGSDVTATVWLCAK